MLRDPKDEEEGVYFKGAWGRIPFEEVVLCGWVGERGMCKGSVAVKSNNDDEWLEDSHMAVAEGIRDITAQDKAWERKSESAAPQTFQDI